jgi:ATPase subunit of ABC transporter with duplicated ATPase domains
MAGLDDGYTGEARLTPASRSAMLEQEPQLDPTKDVKGNVMDGVAEVQGLLDRYNEVMAMWADPDADYEKIGALQAEPGGQDRRRRRQRASTATSRSPWTRCAARPATPTSPSSPVARSAAWRCAACC